MKNLIFIIAIGLFNFNVFSQEKINTDDLIGYWMPNEESTQLFFWKDVDGVLQVQEISGTSGDPLITRDLRINVESVMVKTTFPATNWTTTNYFTLINKGLLKCVVTGDANTILYYTKMK